MKRKYNEGFTLVELMVSILIASIVTLAATTVLLLGIRLNKSASDTAQRQNTTRIFMAVVERMATEGAITSVSNTDDYWKAVGKVREEKAIVNKPEEAPEDMPPAEEKEKILFYYDAAAGVIYTGGEISTDGGGEKCSGGTPLMEGVIESHIAMDGPQLTLDVKTHDGSYTTSVYCRTSYVYQTQDGPGISDAEADLGTAPEEMKGKEARAELLKILLSQRGSSGMILVEDEKTGAMYKTPVYYAQWYEPTWPSDTPWCACFLSWGLAQVSDKINEPATQAADGRYLWFANVDRFMRFFKNQDENGNTLATPRNHRWVNYLPQKAEGGNYINTPAPGDIVFIDWDGKQDDPAHVGMVLAVDKEYIYTIEGNSANMVAVRKYAITGNLIMGYGVIDWK